MRNLSSLAHRNFSYTSVYYTAGYRAKPLRTAIPLGAREKSLPANWAFSLKKSIGSAFIRAWYTAKSGFFAIKYRLENYSAMRTFSLFYQCGSYISTSLTTAFNAAIHLARFSCGREKHSTALKTSSLLDLKSKSFFVMMLSMFIWCKNLKIAKSIVRLYSIFMVNDFIWLKPSSQMSGHNKSMFHHLWFFAVKKFSFSNIYKDISVVIGSATLPVMVKLTSWYRHVLTPLLRESYSI